MGKGQTGALFGGLAAVAVILAVSGKKGSGGPSLDPLDTSDIRLPFDGKPSTFIRLAYPFAVEAHKQFPKVPVLLILTQAGLESNWGKASPGNLFFGVKAGPNWKGDKQLLRTTEVLPKDSGYNFPEVISITKLPSGKYRWVVRDYFRKYPTPLGSFLDYCKLLYTKRYEKALQAKTLKDMIQGIDLDSFLPQISGIKDAGYATDPNYVPKLVALASKVEKQIKEIYPSYRA